MLDPAAAAGPLSVTVTTAAGTSGAQTFTVNPPPGPSTPTLASISPNQGLRGTTVAVTLTGTNFVVGATTVNVGGGMTATNVVVGSTTSLTVNFVLDPVAAAGPRVVTVTTGRRDQRTARLHHQSAAADADERLAESRTSGAKRWWSR